jgi:predicted MPP superfamily phosphohydrolase
MLWSPAGGIVFGYILVSIFTVLHIYVVWRAASVPFLKRHIPVTFIIGAGVLLWASFFLGRVVGHGGSGVVAGTLEFVSMTWMAVLFLLFVSLLAVDLITVFGFLLSRLAPSLRGWALVAGVVLSVIALVQGFRPPVLQNYEVRVPGLSQEMDGTVIVAMSDLHLGSLIGEQWLVKRVSQVREQRPDLVVLLGDLFEGHGKPRGELLPALRRLTAPLGVWAVPGNHEFHGGNNGAMDLLDEAGIRLLRDRWVEVRPGFVVAGVDDLTSSRRRGRDIDHISKAVAGRPPGTTILLSHTPWQTKQAANAGVNLMLCGHTHSGQIWPFGYMVRLFYPLLEGRYEAAGMPVIVSRGTGTWGPRMRLWRPGEILRVTLRRK